MMILTWKQPLKMPDMEPFWVRINGVIWCLGDCELPLASMGQSGRQTVKYYSFKIYTYSGAKKYLVSHQLCKFSHLKR